jgi:hypothetical protein
MRNRIINGAMVIDQRNAGASVNNVASAVTYTLDRWCYFASQASKFSIQQTTTAPAGFNYSTKITSLSAYSVGSGEEFDFMQTVEGYNMADFGWGTANAKTVTISFWVRSSLTGTFGGAIRNSVPNRSYPFTYTISAVDTWEYKTVTIAGDTSGTWNTTNGTGMFMTFGLGQGATYSATAGAWAAGNFSNATGATSVVGTNGATWYVTGVQLEKGTQATSFEYRQYGTELALCQRYFQKTYNIETVPGSATNTGAQTTRVYNTDSFIAQLLTRLPVVMRASPAITGYDTLTGAVNSITQGGVSRTITNIFDIGATTSGFPQSATNPTSGDDCRWQFTASAEL